MSSLPMRSPTPPLDSSSDDLNELSLDQELAQCQRPHFLDHTEIGIPYPADIGPPPIPPRNAMLTSLPLPPHRSSIPVKMVRSAENPTSPIEPIHLPTGKRHFLDENPIPPDYEYDPLQRLGHKEHEDNADTMQIDNQGVRPKHKRSKEPSYALSRFLETDDNATNNRYNIDNEVHLNDVRLTTSTDSVSLAKPGTDCVYSLLSMIGCNSPVEMSRRFLELSKSPNTCATLRHSRCIPLLVQMIHCEADEVTKQQSCEALRNVVNHHPDDKAGRREAKVLRYIEQIMEYCSLLRQSQTHDSLHGIAHDHNNHPLQAMSSLMKISFDEEHRHAMCQLGALQSIANLVHLDHAVHGAVSTDAKCISMRRYADMALTNLTFGDGNNKALLCANRDFMKALVAQINIDADDLVQVTANVLRNLSWRADNNMKAVLNEIGTVTALTVAAMRNKNETTLRAILSALWNLSAHCSKNKRELCQVGGALLFLVEMLTYDAPSKTLSIIENAGGILRNVSSHIAVNEDYRKILRQRNCLGILLKQLKSESLTIVSNACGTLWNLSARCPEDQKFLLENGAVPMLRSLIHSKHKMISDGSKVALKNLINFRPSELNRSGLDPVAKMMGLKELPTLSARKQRALEDVLDEKLPESCDTIETTKPLSHSINQSAPKSFTTIERSLKYVEHDFGQLSLQNTSSKGSFDESSPTGVVRSESWQLKGFTGHQTASDTIGQPIVSHPTGTIPKRTTVKSELDDSPVGESSCSIASTTPKPDSTANARDELPTKAELDADQITNFSLLYSENQSDIPDIKAQEDTIKIYDSEGTPPIILSTATSLSDLRPTARAIHLQRLSKSGRTTTENSGINTPERPIQYYYAEDSSTYHSRRDSINSESDGQRATVEYAQKPSQLAVNETHNADAIASNLEHMQSINENDGNSGDDTVPSTPGECASKTVTFNEFILETPMMFSRHSSLGSLGPHEAAMNDEIESVVSEFSRQPSGNISPSEIPDSPSQSMPQSPRPKRTAGPIYAPVENATAPPFNGDEVKTFAVENTPVHISCATSISNLSFDDEQKVTNDGLIKEMSLMHQLSDEKRDEPPASIEVATRDDTSVPSEDRVESISESRPVQLSVATASSTVPKVENIADDSDSDDSSDDGEIHSQLLEDCINMGIKASKQAPVPDIKSPPALPKPTDILDDDCFSSDEDANENDNALLEQCIQIGIRNASSAGQAKFNINTTNQLHLMPKANTANAANYDSNDSISSIDDEANSNALLQQCIQDGIRNTKSLNEPKSQNEKVKMTAANPTLFQRRSQLPTPRVSTSSSHRSRSKMRNPYDDHSAIGSDKSNKYNTHVMYGRNMDRMQLNTGNVEHQHQSAHGYSKNAQATSATVSRIVGAPDVVKIQIRGIDKGAHDQHQRDDISSQIMTSMNNDPDQSTVVVDDISEITASAALMVTEIGYSQNPSTLDTSVISMRSRNSFGGEIPLLEQSNEFPAHFNQNDGLSDSQNSSSVDMEVSNECLFDNASPLKMDKHKDPNLMLQSVERLTQELVSTAEYLRTANSLEDDDDVTITEAKSKTYSNDTWNEDTHPNAASFPSISQLVPIIANNMDLTFSEKNGNSCGAIDSISEVKTDSDGICFEIGGEISQTNYVGVSHDSHDTSTALTNSTIIAMEANKIHAEIMKIHGKTDSTLSLDKIRPPSVMERMNNSSYCESLNGPISLRNSPAKYFPTGVMARRAIQPSNNQGSMESINSSCTYLDRVKPPSLMDGLLDSMISLDSIKTEFVDVKSHMPLDETSHYETALSECDDLTTTLKCCADLPFDETPCGSDFSSVESTPKKGRRSTTPRRKRQTTKDRYKTYTIPDDEVAIARDVLKQPIADDNHKLFHMQISSHALLTHDFDSDTISLVSADDNDMSSIRALTRNLVYLNDNYVDDISCAQNDNSINTNTFTKHSRAVGLNGFYSTPPPSGDFYESLPMDEQYESNQSNSPNRIGSPRIVKHNEYSADGPLSNKASENCSPTNEPKAIRGRKKLAYVSPYAMGKLTKATCPTVPVRAVVSPPLPTKAITSTLTAKTVAKVVTTKAPPVKATPSEGKTKSFIQRSAESLKKFRPSLTAKLTKTSPKNSEKPALEQQKSIESNKSDRLIRQNTFTKDEPSEGEVPVIASAPASPAKTKSLVSKIPFNRTISLQPSGNVVKCKTNIEIPAQKKSAASITRRFLKSASSTSQMISSPSTTPKSLLSPRSSIDTPSTSRNLFKKWSPNLKATISSPLPATATKSKVSTLRAPIVSIPVKKGGMKSTLLAKPSKIASSRIISTNGKTMQI